MNPLIPAFRRRNQAFSHHDSMSLIDLLFHLLNFVAPSLVVSVLLVIAGPIFIRKRVKPSAIWSQLAINIIVGVTVLALGLVLLGRDGKMLTYLAMVLALATSAWWQSGGWKK